MSQDVGYPVVSTFKCPSTALWPITTSQHSIRNKLAVRNFLYPGVLNQRSSEPRRLLPNESIIKCQNKPQWRISTSQHSTQDKCAVRNYLFAIATKAHTSPKTKSRFLVVLKSFVPMWIITVSGLPRYPFSITLCSCSVLIPWKHSTIISVSSAPNLCNINSPTTMQFALFCFA